ncbi:CAP domain-containing protein [Rhizoctonia solani]|nr:CAP domain-containing protein [Rhizoctonia solani]
MVRSTVAILALVTASLVSAHRRNEDLTNNMNGTHLFTARTTAQDYLAPHNNERAEHGAKALVWDDGLASSAEAWANQCKFQHSQSGENLYAGTGNPTAADAIGAWNSESKDYSPENPEASHWTQVVWKETTELGCALNQCAPGTIFDAKYGVTNYYVCHYNPAGNVIGQFPQNVQK